MTQLTLMYTSPLFAYEVVPLGARWFATGICFCYFHVQMNTDLTLTHRALVFCVIIQH